MPVYVDLVDYDQFSIHELDRMLEELGYNEVRILFYHFKKHGYTLDDGLGTHRMWFVF